MNQNQGNQNVPSMTQVGGNNGTPWSPQSSEKNNFFYNPNDPNNSVMGFFKAIDHIPTPQFGPQSVMTIYVIHVSDGNGNLGQIINLAGDTFLSKRMEHIALNSFIQLKYTGRKLKKEVPLGTPIYKTNSFHTWEVGTWVECPLNYRDLLQKAGFAQPNTQPANTVPQYQSQQPAYNQAPAQNYQPPAQQNTYQPPVQQPYVQQQNPPAQMPQHYQDRVQQQNPTLNQPPVYQQPPMQQQPAHNQQQNTAPNLPPAPSFMQNQQPPVQQPPVQQPPAFGQNIQNPFTQQLNNDAAQQYNQDIKY